VFDTLFEMDPILIFMDGVSDTSDVITRFLTTGANIVRDRLSSISKFAHVGSYKRLNTIINKVIDLIPDEIDIPGTGIYSSGGLSSNLTLLSKDG